MDEQRTFLTVTIPINDEFLEEEIIPKTRFSRKQIRQNILDSLKVNEEISLNELSSRLNYKGISKTLSSIIEELIEENIITREKARGSNSKIKRIK